MRNRHGLNRSIPPEIKKAVRFNCGFGCVICGGAIIEYDHIDPEFKDARIHDEKGITLLCPGCHSKKTRGFLSKETILEAMGRPRAKEQGFSSELFDFGKNHPSIKIGGSTIANCHIPIQIHGMPILKIDAPEQPGSPFCLSGSFHDSYGKQSLFIDKNEWRPLSSNWDVEAVGGVVTIRDNPGRVSLQIRSVPPEGLIFEKIEMYFRRYRIEGSPDELRIGQPGGAWFDFHNFHIDNCHTGFSFG